MDESQKVLDHDYDGIQEYDNPLPGWWLITFFITIIFGFLYWIDSEFANRPNQFQQAAAEVQYLKQLSPKHNQAPNNEEDFKALISSKNNLDQGRRTFVAKCSACHGLEAEGLIGPNLTDEYWIHGKGNFVDVSRIIRNGIPEKGMPAWEEQISVDDLKKLSAFVVSLRGSTPRNPKPAQGEKIGL